MRNNRKGTHSIHQLHVHLVWSTKYRYDVLRTEVQVRCRDLIRQSCDSMDIQVLKGVVSKDHVHLHMHASYCSAVAFSEGDILVAASTDHFADRGAVYRRPIDGKGPLEPVRGLPRWLGGIVDTGCIATLGPALAVADRAGNLYASADAGNSWRHRDTGLPMMSRVLLV